MKVNFKISVAILIALMLGMGAISPILAQPDAKLHVYIWDFSVSHDSLNKYAKVYRNDLETGLINLDKYTVLERRRYDRIMAHQDMENNILDVRNLSPMSKDSLKANKADAVFFGELVFNDGSGKYKVNVTFQSLDGRILKQGDIIIDKAKIDDFELSKEFVKDLLKVFYSKEILSAKKEQFQLIDEKLSSYRARVDEIAKIYGEVIETLLVERDPVEYSNELKQKIEAYNMVWNDLNDNKGKYLHDFGSHWGKDRLRDFTDIYSKIMNDFHERFIRKLDDVRIDIGEFKRDQSSNKREKEEKKKFIVNKTIKMTADMRTELNNTIKPQINAFLNKLRDELISE